MKQPIKVIEGTRYIDARAMPLLIILMKLGIPCAFVIRDALLSGHLSIKHIVSANVDLAIQFTFGKILIDNAVHYVISK